MRKWLFHPLIFYPLAILAAALVIGFSLRPQSWPRTPAPVEAEVVDGALVFEGAGFDRPANGPEQQMTVVRDFWGRAQSLRIAQLANQPAPGPADQGARLLMTPEQAAMIEDRPVTVEVSYIPIAINSASGLAVSLQGIAAADWVSQEAPAEPSTLSFELPPQIAIDAIGLRALSGGSDQAYGLEITRVRVIPHD